MRPNPTPCLLCGYASQSASRRCEACERREPAARAGAVEGFLAAPRGLGFLLRTPRTKRYAVVPFLLALALFSVGGYFSWSATESLRLAATSAAWIPEWIRPVVALLVGALLLALCLLVVWLTASTVTAAIAAPILDLLVGRVDEVRAGRPRSVGISWLADARFTVLQALATLAFLLPWNLAAFAVAWIPPIGPAASFFLMASAAGFGALDLAASRRRWTFGQKLRVYGANFPAFFGLGAALALTALVPCVGWMVTIPVAATAGTLLFGALDLRAA